MAVARVLPGGVALSHPVEVMQPSRCVGPDTCQCILRRDEGRGSHFTGERSGTEGTYSDFPLGRYIAGRSQPLLRILLLKGEQVAMLLAEVTCPEWSRGPYAWTEGHLDSPVRGGCRPGSMHTRG